MENKLIELAKRSKAAAYKLSLLSTNQKNQILQSMADELLANQNFILEANSKDIQAGKEKGLSDAMLDRLLLTSERLTSMANAIREIIQLPDPVGEISNIRIRPNGIQVGMMRIPLGVIGIIYEARPNVTSDAAALCIKSGNAVILRGGSEAFNSNFAIVNALHKGIEKCGVDSSIITFVPTTDREAILELLKLDEYIDLLIPRGSNEFVRFIMDNSRIPVMGHADGICHSYVDESANIN
ncbi:MAG: glutamate-5-semialdehyde dehydrogenase, partial [Melioribacter sp.]|nr:glutamate-5-semialdehyde dehydrogenase [Melioribacter sp.]